MALPININDLLNGKPVEWERLEFKVDGTKSGPSRDQVEILRKYLADYPITDPMAVADRANRIRFWDQILKPMLADGLLEMLIADKPTSSTQHCRTTNKGRNLFASLKEGGA